MPEMNSWPELPYEAWKDTLDTLHMNTQVVGKLRLALSPPEPQWANVALYLTPRGRATGPMSSGGLIFGVDLDLVAHQVSITTATGETRQVGSLRVRWRFSTRSSWLRSAHSVSR